jgi:hypothetical protein
LVIKLLLVLLRLPNRKICIKKDCVQNKIDVKSFKFNVLQFSLFFWSPELNTGLNALTEMPNFPETSYSDPRDQPTMRNC